LNRLQLNGGSLSDFLIFLLIAGGMIGLCAWIGAVVVISGHPILSRFQKTAWILIVTVLPIVGPLLYFSMFADGLVKGKSYRQM
jgi:hypothetical protein